MVVGSAGSEWGVVGAAGVEDAAGVPFRSGVVDVIVSELGGGLHAVRLGRDHAIVGAAPGGIAEGVVDVEGGGDGSAEEELEHHGGR